MPQDAGFSGGVSAMPGDQKNAGAMEPSPAPPYKSGNRPTLAIIGAGRVGGTLAYAAHSAGYAINAIYTRSPKRAGGILALTEATLLHDIVSTAQSADLIFIAVPDDVITEIDEAGREAWQPGKGVVHLSGLHGSDILEHAARAGAWTGTFHPLRAIPTVVTAPNPFRGTYFGISGHQVLIPRLRTFAESLGGIPITIPDDGKALYHTAAVFASNYIVTCFAIAVDLLTSLDIDSEHATQALLPLTEGAVANLAHHGLPAALTGPITRGDTGTLTIHQQQLASTRPDLLPLYQLLGKIAISTAAAQGHLSEDALRSLSETLDELPVLPPENGS